MLSLRGVKGDDHLLKKSHGGFISRPEGVTWKNLRLGDDRINARREKGREVCGPPLLPFCNTASQTPLMLCLKQPQKKRSWKSVRGMMRWRDEGGEGSSAGSGGACVCELGPLEVSFCLCPSWSPVFVWSHAASCIIPQLWVTGPGVKARQQGQILHRSGLTDCVFSLPVFSDSSWIICPGFCFDFTLQIMIRFVLLPLQGSDMHSYCMHYTSPLPLIESYFKQAKTACVCYDILNKFGHSRSTPKTIFELRQGLQSYTPTCYHVTLYTYT